MISWKEYKANAKQRGAMALELFVAISTPVKLADHVASTLPKHLEYQASLERRGQLAFAGPLSDDTGELMTGAGLIIYRAADLNEARTLADQDPMHKSGARTYTLRRWLINEGSFSLQIGLSTCRTLLR